LINNEKAKPVVVAVVVVVVVVVVLDGKGTVLVTPLRRTLASST